MELTNLEKILFSQMAFYYAYICLLLFFTFSKRKMAVAKKEMSFEYFKVYEGSIPEEVKVFGNHLNNQFQMPLIFFITCLAAVQTKSVDWIAVVLGFVFVGTRMIHSLIHLGKNRPLKRATFYSLGMLAIFFLWLNIIFTIYN
jgi:hypothetical protein